MSDHEIPARAVIDIVAWPGAAETLLALHAREGSATIAQLRRAGAGNSTNVLPMLAAAGLVTSRGTLDEAEVETLVTLTAAGDAFAAALLGLTSWMRRHRATSARRPGWTRPFRLVWLYLQILRCRMNQVQ